MSHIEKLAAVAARRKSLGRRWIALLGMTVIAALRAAAATPAPAPTTTTLSIEADGSPVTTISWGTPVALTATVFAGKTPVTAGTVNFCDASALHCEDIHRIGQAQLTAAGTATLHLKPGIAVHQYQAVFVGTIADASSASAVSTLAVVGAANTSTAIQSSGSAGNYQLTGTVTAFGSAAPAGKIFFENQSNNNTVAASASLDAATLVSGFTLPQSYGAGSGPSSIAAADFRGIGTLDLAVANSNDGTLSVLWGNGDGTFSAARNYKTGTLPYAVAAGDFNNDGITDLVVANYGDDTLTVLLGNGDGTFTTEVVVAAGSMPAAIAVGDFNRDGNLDLAIADYGSASLSLLLGNGNGSFQSPLKVGTGNGPRGIAVGDFDGDGHLDLVTANYSDGNISVLLGNGDGTFQPATTYSLAPDSGHASGVAVADFNGDGFPDIAVAGTNDVSMLLNQGTGSFKSAAAYTAGSGIDAVAIGDFNLDGVADLAVASVGSQDLSVLFAVGDGTFGTPLNLKLGGAPQATAVGDFNADGRPDLAAAVSGPANFAGVLLGIQTATATVEGVSVAGKGVQQVAASIPADPNHNFSVSSAIPLVGTGISTSLSVTAVPTPTPYGQAPTIIATLTPVDASGITSSNFTAFLDSTGLLSVSAIGNDQFQLTGPALSSLTLGAHAVSVNFQGNATYLAIAGSVPLTVVQDTPTLKWTPPSSIGYGTALSAVLTASALDGTTGVAGSYVYTATPAGGNPSTVNGLTQLVPGTYTINVTFTPTNTTNFASAGASAPLSVTTGRATLTMTASPNPAFAGTPVTLTATLTASGVAPTGSVQFVDGQSTVLSTVTLTGGSAAFTTSSLAIGGHSLTAVYSGDSNYQSSGSSATTENVEDFTMTATFPYGSPTPPVVLPGGTVTVNVKVTPTLGTAFPSAVTLSASGLPAGATATFSPQSLAAGSNTNSATLTIALANRIATDVPSRPFGGKLALAFAGGILLLPFIKRRRWPNRNDGAKLAGIVLLLIAGICATLSLTACGGGGSSGYFGQQAKNFTVNVTAASGTLSHSASATFTVE